MLLVYTHNTAPRLRYVFRHICVQILGLEVKFTNKVEDFIAHAGLKMSYTKQPIGDEFFVKCHDILFQQGLDDIEIQVQDWGHTKCFFYNGDKCSLQFDIFAASFYMLSRYEEYLPHVKDEYGRFQAVQSLGYKHKFLHQPVVDIWAYKFKDALQQQFPDFQFPKKTYRIKPVIDVPSAYYYRLKGIMRTLGGTIKDFLNLRFKSVYSRYAVLSGLKHDPNDTYRYILNRQKKSGSKFLFFFIIGDYSTYDKGINPNKKKYVSLIKHIADYCDVGLKTSFLAIDDAAILKKEKIKMEDIINKPLVATRQSFSRINLPEFYRNLLELEIMEDYTMGYVNQMGFRAGTCTPFLFYDLDFEIQTPLKVYSYHLMDYALLKKQSYLDKKQALEEIINEVKKVNGMFIPVFHNYTFSDNPRWKGFKDLFNLILDSVKAD